MDSFYFPASSWLTKTKLWQPSEKNKKADTVGCSFHETKMIIFWAVFCSLRCIWLDWITLHCVTYKSVIPVSPRSSFSWCLLLLTVLVLQLELNGSWALMTATRTDCPMWFISTVMHQPRGWVHVFVSVHAAWEAGRKVCVCVYTKLIFSIRLILPVRRGEAQRSAHCFLMKSKKLRLLRIPINYFQSTGR